MANNRVTIMGSYVADVAFRIDRLPAWGETCMGESFQLGPGGKGSNQAVAAARAGANVSFISKLGPDPFGEIARTLYSAEGIDTQHVFPTPNPTGAAAILIHATRGATAIIAAPPRCSPRPIRRNTRSGRPLKRSPPRRAGGRNNLNQAHTIRVRGRRHLGTPARPPPSHPPPP